MQSALVLCPRQVLVRWGEASIGVEGRPNQLQEHLSQVCFTRAAEGPSWPLAQADTAVLVVVRLPYFLPRKLAATVEQGIPDPAQSVIDRLCSKHIHKIHTAVQPSIPQQTLM